MKINGIFQRFIFLIVPFLIIIFMFALILDTQAGVPGAETGSRSYTGSKTDLRLVETTEDGILLELISDIPQFETNMIDDQACQSVSITDLIQSELPGLPALPVKGTMIGIPEDAQPSIQILEAESTSLPGKHDLCPSAKPILIRTSQGTMEQTGYSYERGPAYQINAWTPSANAELVSMGYIRSQRFAQIRINPIQYNPVTGEVRYYSRIRIEVKFHSNDMKQAESLLNSEQAESSSYIDEGYFEESLQDTLLNYEQARTWRSQPSASAQADILAAPLSTPAYKLLVDEDGIYQVSYEDLLAAGVITETLDGIEPLTFQLFNQADEVALYVDPGMDSTFDPGDYFLFYGQKANTKYTDTNVYWLYWGVANGLRMASLVPPIDPTTVPSEFLTTQHAEDDHEYYFEESSGPDHDHWYWGMVYAWDAPAHGDYSTVIKKISPISHTISVRGLLEGYSASPNHHTKIYLNGNLIDDHSFSTGSEYNFNISNLPLSYMQELTNTLRVECPRDGSITLDAVLVNWFEIDYYDSFYAENNQLFFSYDQVGNWEYQTDGFSSTSLEAYDITNPLSPVRITSTEVLTTTNGHLLAFKAGILDEHHYLAQATTERLSPDIILDNPSNLKSTSNEADYILISHADFLSQIQPLASFRVSQGLRVQIVDIQDIYDEFNGGVLSPEAIKSFLAYAYDQWAAPAPSFVLLVGDGSYDYKNALGWNEDTYIPPYLAEIDPWIGETASDNRFVNVSGGDILPDMYIGRFPVRTAAEAQTMVEKALNYEQVEPSGGWNAKQLFVADKKDSAGNFPVLSDGIINTFIPDWYTVDKIYYGSSPYTDANVARAAVKAAINDGRLIVHYAGHGDIQYWSSGYLLKVEELSTLTNSNKLPFMIPMTCMEGYFAFPSPAGDDYSSVGETIVRLSGKGAIASFSPTGWGSSTGHNLLDRSIFSDLFRSNQTQLGYLTTHAKYYLFANSISYYYLIDTYILFGDPALRLQTVPMYTVFLPIVVH